MADKNKTACQVMPDLWFSDDSSDQAYAKAACAKCPLLTRCGEMGWDQVHGIWGGLSELDRKKKDPERYARAQARAHKESAEFDVVVANVVKRMREDRLGDRA